MIKGEVMHEEGQELFGKSLYSPLNFSVNQKIALKKLF